MRTAVIGSLLLAVALLVGIGGYAVGRSSGEDLDSARAAGRTAGAIQGTQRGKKLGYATGYRKGRSAGYTASYPAAYREAYRAAYADSGLTAPARRAIEVSLP